MTMRNEINAVDLAFVVDTTGSMGSLIQAAQNQMVAMLEEVTRAASINLWLGVVEYRDHPPQDKMLYEVYPFTADMQEAQKNIQRLQANGGGDAPEAVPDGITAACCELAWWKHSRRLIILVGDAPPHGMGMGGDAFPHGCPCGETIESVTRLAEEQRLIKRLLQYPSLVAGAAHAREPHRVAYYLTELAGLYHPYYKAHRVITDDRALTLARLGLAAAVGQVVRNGLDLLGVSAPESM